MTKTKEKILNISIYALFALFLVIAIALKVNYHIDELYSYNLSNHHHDTFNIGIVYDEEIRYESYKDMFMEYATVNPNNRFNIVDVWNNQAMDVHPPIYYLLFNFVCSLFPGSFSKWYPGIINIIFALATLYFVRKLIKLFVSNKFYEYLLTFIYILTTGIIDNVAYFRMYIIASFWVTVATYLFIYYLDKKKDISFFLPITFVTYLGALTHYYCIVYCVLISVTYGIYLLIHKEYKNTIIFSCCMAIAGIGSYLTFPAMVKHMFFEYRGEEATTNIFNFADFSRRFQKFFKDVGNEIFGEIWLYVLIVIAILLVLFFAKNRKVSDKKLVDRYIFIFVPSTIYFFLVVKIASYLSERYISPIYPELLIGELSLIINLINGIANKNTSKKICVILSLVLLVSGYYHAEWEYLYRDTNVFVEGTKRFNNTDCICIDGLHGGEILHNSIEFSNYKSLTIVNQDRVEIINQFVKSDKIVIKLLKINDPEEMIDRIKGLLPQFNNCELIGDTRGVTYYLY